MKILREKARLTQEQLGILVSLDQSYISKLENGHNVDSLTIYHLMKIAKVLKVCPPVLLMKLIHAECKITCIYKNKAD